MLFRSRIVPYDRSVQVQESQVILRDRTGESVFRMPLACPAAPMAPAAGAISPVDWRSVFGQAMPAVQPADAFGAVLLYPDNETEIAELPAQPFVADYLDDVSEQDREIGAIVARAEHIGIQNGDAVIATCIPFDRPRAVTVWYRQPAHAQKQAQQLWTQCAAIQHWEWLTRIRFLPDQPAALASPSCDLVYQWVPYEAWQSAGALTALAEQLRRVVRSGGNAFVVGPAQLRDLLARQKFLLRWDEAVDTLPTFRMHRTILPKARLKAGLTLFHVTAP